MPPRLRPRALLALLALTAPACRVGPEYARPDLSARTDPPWRATSGPALAAERTELAGWWRRLGSEELDGLARRLLAGNLSLAEARQRVLAARAARGVAGAAARPQVGAGAAYLHAGTGDKSLNFQGPPPGTDVDVWSTSVDASWELDLWGRVARRVEAADAEAAGALEDWRAAAVALLAQLALAYVDADVLHARLALADEVVVVRADSVALARSRADAGNGPRLAVAQAERELELARARPPELRRALRAAEDRIALLVGERPSDGLVAATDELTLPPEVGLGVPADLLARRADVRSAERDLAASVARVGAARAERLPSIAIGGELALRSMDAGDLASGAPALSYSIGPQLHVPLFSGGRLAAEEHVEAARSEGARLAFEHALLQAAAEVEDAAEGVARTRERLASLLAALGSASHAVELAEERNAGGLSARDEVLAARGARIAVADELQLARQAAFAQTIDLYHALGGGWEPLTPDGAAPAGVPGAAEAAR